MEARNYYKSVLNVAQEEIARLSWLAGVVSWARVGIFIAVITGVIMLWDMESVAWIVGLSGLALFLAIVKYHDVLLRRRTVQQARRNIAESRLRVLAGDLSCQPRGERYINHFHSFTYDLDVFGRGSLFSLLDSTATPMGADKLAKWLECPLTDADEIISRQQGIKELAGMNELRTSFHAIGVALDGDNDENKHRSIPDFENIPSFALSSWQRFAVGLAIPIYVGVALLAISGIIQGMWVMWLTVAYLAITGMMSKRIGRLHEWLATTVSMLTMREDLFRSIENSEFKSSLLAGLREDLSCEGVSASRLITQLSKLLKAMDQRLNVVGFVLFNGTMLWDLSIMNKIDKWMKCNGALLSKWHKTIGEIDALSALATFAFENPSYIFPNIDVKGEIIMNASDLGHPLINSAERVNNPLPEMGRHSFIVITGANMAGKSTYLRTIGVNYLLALIGAPVAAKSMTFTPAELFTGLRVTDSLVDGESYFFAELRRLQAVIKEASQNKSMFILLDEILRGTNSADKQRGSFALVRKLVTLPVAGILATHDLALGTLADEYPENVSAYCFEAEIDGDNLKFDYRMRKGIAQNLNAYFLMERMGIV